MLLRVEKIRVSYDSVEVLKGVSIEVDKGKTVCLLGANGAGKSTTLRAISSLVQLKNGAIYFDDRRIDGLPPHHVVQKGIVHVPEERRLFCEMSVQENLEMGAYLQKNPAERRESLEQVLTIFPRLSSMLKRRAGTLSGGEQQMAAIGRGLMARPRLLLMDEPTLGLSPLLCDAVMECILEIKKLGTSLLLSEQNAELALSVSDAGYIMRLGEVALHGSCAELMSDERVRKAYLGL